jgi:hypothetical protein
VVFGRRKPVESLCEHRPVESKGEAMNDEIDKPPFPRHRVYYTALKFAIMAAGLLLALYVFGFVWSL